MDRGISKKYIWIFSSNVNSRCKINIENDNYNKIKQEIWKKELNQNANGGQ